jgi:hypothetical protein
VKRIACTALTFVALAACGASAAGGSGVRITVTAGPTCPVERNPPDPNCKPKPMDATIRIATRGGRTVATLRTGSDGKVSKRLGAGSYRATAGNTNPGVMPACRPVNFTVHKGRYTSVRISCDTGIR